MSELAVVATAAAVTLQRAIAKCSTTATGRSRNMNSDELKSIAHPHSLTMTLAAASIMRRA
jgi:hypothetical protein